MAPSSSTSSSSPRLGDAHFSPGPRAPRALIAAVLVIATVEIALRLVDLPGLNPYAWGMGEYDSAAIRLREDGPPEVMVLGTSRAREAINHERLGVALGLRVGNYGLSGARAGEAREILRRALRHGRPKLVLIGMEPRLLQGRREHRDRQARFWSWGQAWDAGARDLLGITARTYLGDVLRAFRYRERLAGFVRGEVDPRVAIENPIDGGRTLFQQDSPDVSLATRPIDPQWVERHLDHVMEDGTYRITPARIDALRTIIRMARTTGAEVVLFEIPMSRMFQHYLPMGTMEAYRRVARRLAEEEKVRFIRLTRLRSGFSFRDRDFYDPSHLSWSGAWRFTDALAAALR